MRILEPAEGDSSAFYGLRLKKIGHLDLAKSREFRAIPEKSSLNIVMFGQTTCMVIVAIVPILTITVLSVSPRASI
jgi:hypothetical protein